MKTFVESARDLVIQGEYDVLVAGALAAPAAERDALAQKTPFADVQKAAPIRDEWYED